MSTHERFLAWIVTGPIGRFYAFFADLAAYWWRWARAKVSGARQR
jgi:hypothetical protein